MPTTRKQISMMSAYIDVVSCPDSVKWVSVILIAHFCGWAGQFESYLAVHPTKDKFSHDVAHESLFWSPQEILMQLSASVFTRFHSPHITSKLIITN